MIALPSIAFGGFSGSAKGVTARYQDGRSILSLKSYPTGETTIAQLAHRTNFSKINKSYKLLSDAQMRAWENLAEHASGSFSIALGPPNLKPPIDKSIFIGRWFLFRLKPVEITHFSTFLFLSCSKASCSFPPFSLILQGFLSSAHYIYHSKSL